MSWSTFHCLFFPWDSGTPVGWYFGSRCVPVEEAIVVVTRTVGSGEGVGVLLTNRRTDCEISKLTQFSVRSSYSEGCNLDK